MIDWLTLIALIGGILIVEGRYRQLHGRIKKLEKNDD